MADQNRIRSILVGQGLPAPRGAKAWSAAGLAGIAQFARPLAECGPDVLWWGMLDLALTAYRQAEELVAAAEAKLVELGRADRRVQLLDTVPGLGPRTAEAVVAFVDDPHRFRNAKAVGRYFGLVPCQDQSGDRNRLGHITREGTPVVRQLLAEAAWQAIRWSPTVRAYFERVQREDPQRQKIALVATAHYLVRAMWAMLRHGTTWQENQAA